MNKIFFTGIAILLSIVLTQASIYAQEFPIAVGTDTTFSGGAAYGGLNGIVAVQGDANSPYSINAQLIGSGGTLIGPRISLGSYGMFPGAMPAFDGTNYFLVWQDFGNNLMGQFISTAGNLVGNSITIATNVSTEYGISFFLIFGDNEYFAAFIKSDGYLYGQFVNKDGGLVGSQIKISNNLARDISMAFDGTNFLVTWVKIIQEIDKDIYGQFVSKEGLLVGSNFLIDGGPNYSDNPTSIAFDGTRYLLVYHDQPPTSRKWFIMGQFISTTGALEDLITIRDTSFAPGFPCVAFDNTNYLVTWSQQTDMKMYGRFYNKSGSPIADPFVIMTSSEGKFPIGGVGFGGGLYLVVATKMNSEFTDGDVYGRFISPVTSVNEKTSQLPKEFALSQNYPNPFNPTTTIKFDIPSVGTQHVVSLRVYDILGKEVATLVNEQKEAGSYEVQFDASKLASGIYFYRLTAGSYTAVKKLVLMK